MGEVENPAPVDQAAASRQLLMRVPGRARPQRAALEEFDKGVAELRKRYKPVFWPLFIPEAENMFRWRIQLSCGCTHEVLTRGEDDYPDDRSKIDPITDRSLPVGEYWCTTDHGAVPKPYRDIVEWVDRKVTEFPPDPEEPIYEWMDAETWAKIRKPEPHAAAFWQVKLACDHYDQVCTDVEWKPEDGPVLVSDERLTEIRRDFEDLWAEEGETGWPHEGPERDHMRRMIDLRWPRPQPEHACFTCTRVGRITGYQRIGWLVSRTKPAASPSVDRARLTARIAAAEAEVRRLRKQLEEADDA